jgi:integrase
MCPEECHRLRWDNIHWGGGRNGVLLITKGKAKAAQRLRLRESAWCWRTAGSSPKSQARAGCGPPETQDGHINHDSLKLQHKKALKLVKIRPFEIYSIRHTFLTRLGESGCDAWTLARIAGHSNISISQR